MVECDGGSKEGVEIGSGRDTGDRDTERERDRERGEREREREREREINRYR